MTKHFGDYKQTVFNVILIPLIIVLILINIRILYLFQKKTKNYKIIKIIVLAGFAGLLINIVINTLAENRRILSEYDINSKADLTLYKNETFEIFEHSPHVFQYWSGKYTISNDTLFLNDIDLKKIPHLRLSQKFIYDKKTENYIGSETKLLKKK